MIGVVRVRTARSAHARETPTRATHSSSSSCSSVGVLMGMVRSAGATDGPAHTAREPGSAHGHACVTVRQPAATAA